MKATKELITQLRKGSFLAFKSIYGLYSAHIYNFTNSLLCDDTEAEDITQEVFVSLWEKRDSLNTDKNFDAYIFTIARNLVYDQWNSRFHADNYMRYLQTDWDEQGSAESEEIIMVDSLGEYIDTLIDQLPSVRREIFLLSRKHHLSTKEIAQRLSISERTVETQIYRALQYLRKHLAEEGIMAWITTLIVNEC